MRKFFTKSLLLVSPFLLVAIIIPPSKIDSGLKRSKYARNFVEWNDIFESKINTDLLIQGSSRAWVHISPKSLDSAFNLNAYNLGIDGYSFRLQYYRFLLFLKYNKKPKYLIQSLDYFTEFQKNVSLYEYEQFIPFLDDKLIQEAVFYYEGFTYKDLYIPFYKYTHNMKLYFNGLKFFLLKRKQQSNGKYKGFKAQDKQWDNSFDNFKKANPNGYLAPIDKNTLNLFDLFIRYCQQENIKLIFVNCPTYYPATKMLINKYQIDSIYHFYSVKYSIPYLDYSNNSLSFDTLNFYNSQHLNSAGVDKFNVKLISDLKKIIKE